MSPTIHASAVLVGAHAVLIRGPSGSGKSRLALALLQSGALAFARLVADDRVHAEKHHGRLILRPAHALAGLIEVRGLGIERVPFEPAAVARWVVDVAAPDAERLPAEAAFVSIEGIRLTRLAVAPGTEALPMVLRLVKAEVLPAARAPYKAA